jgi:hypothetical protein
MAFARAKVVCRKRDENMRQWTIDSETGELAVSGVTPPERMQHRSGPVSPDGKCYRSFEFGGSYPQTGVDENERFWDATPSIELKLSIQNANVDFEVGKHYYLDFVRTQGEAAL